MPESKKAFLELITKMMNGQFNLFALYPVREHFEIINH